MAHASVGRGVVRMILPGDTGFGLPRLDGPAGAAAGTVVLERMPAALWATLGARAAPAGRRPSWRDGCAGRSTRAGC
jgi:hypothetical protein